MRGRRNAEDMVRIPEGTDFPEQKISEIKVPKENYKKKKHSKKRKAAIAAATAVAVTGAAGGSLLLYRNTGGSENPRITTAATETTAQLGSISNTIVGTGNLETDTPVALKIPSGITVSEVKVESGDHVSSGDVLAVVDETSVLDAMAEVQEEIDALDEQIALNQEEGEEETIAAGVDGRVKKIYIQEEGDISECMLKNSALMVLSLDGYMALDLEVESGAVQEDDTVTVSLPDGTQTEGTVGNISQGRCTVLITDNGIEADTEASVPDSEGTLLGSGEIYIHQPLEMTGTMGTVSAVNVSENEEVESGDTLLTLADDRESTQYALLYAQREALTETLKELLTLSREGTIQADMDGTIAEIYVSQEESSSEGESSQSTPVSAMQMSYTGGTGGSVSGNSVRLQTLGAVQTVKLSAQTPVQETAVEEKEEVPEENLPEDTGETEQAPLAQPLYLSVQDSSVSTSGVIGILSPRTGETGMAGCDSQDGSYTGTIVWNPRDSSFLPGVTYQANVTLYASEGYCFETDSISSASGVLSGVSVSEDAGTVSFTVTFPETQALSGEEPSPEEETDPDGNPGEGNDGEVDPEEENNGKNQGAADSQENSGGQEDGNSSGEKTSGQTPSAGGASQGGSTQSGSSGGGAGSYSGGSAASSAGSEKTTEETTESSSQYSTDTTAFTISGDEAMLLSVSVDELDINSVTTGQKAEVTFDAIDGKTFEGTVTKVGNTASASGGVAKYTVEIAVPKEAEMKQGMNASATIVIEEKENIVTIPVNALQERGDEVFVYTQKGEDGTLTGEQKVSTGLSDGENVEITEGLSQGDTVYYQKKGGQSSTSGGTASMTPKNSGEMPGGGFGSGGPGGSRGSGSTGGGMGTPPER